MKDETWSSIRYFPLNRPAREVSEHKMKLEQNETLHDYSWHVWCNDLAVGLHVVKLVRQFSEEYARYTCTYVV